MRLSATSSLGPRLASPGTSASPEWKPGSLVAVLSVVVVGGGGGTLLQPLTVPLESVPAALMKFSLKMNRAGVIVPPWLITNCDVGLKTIPVGRDAVTSRPTLLMGSFPFAPR